MALATNTTAGEIQLTGDLAGDGGAQIGSSPQLTHISGLTPGQYVNAKLTVDAKGRVTAIQTATPTEISSGLPVASASEKGVVSIGDNLYMTVADTSGYQSVNLGGIHSGSPLPSTGLDSCALYSFDLLIDGASAHTVSNTGGNLLTLQDIVDEINAIIGITASIDSGNLLITSDTSGRGSSISITNDEMFRCVTGFVIINAGVDGTASCELYAANASAGLAGVVQIGDGIDVNGGVISVDLNSTPIATTSELGGVIVPVSGNIDVDASGNISIPVATSSTPGVVQINTGEGFTIDGNGLLGFDSGTYTPASASDTVKGIMQIGDYLNDTLGGGIVSADKATNTTFGVVKSADTNNITITNGLIDTGTAIPVTSDVNTWSATQYLTPDTASTSGAIASDLSTSNVFDITLTGNATLSNPTNVAAGFFTFIITQDATGGRTLGFGSSFKFKNGFDNTISSGSNDVNVISCLCDGTDMLCSISKDFV